MSFSIPVPPSELPCCVCGNTINWKYEDECSKCRTFTELTLDEYHRQMSVVKKQYEEHAADLEELDEPLFI